MKAEIRYATPDDVPALLAMGREFFAASGLSDLASWDDGSFKAICQSLMDDAVLGSLLVVECDGELVGMAGSVIYPLYCNHAVLMGQEVFWFVQPDHRTGIGATLLDELEADARCKGAVLFISAQIAGQRDEAFARVYARRGYRPSENTFIRRLAS